MAESDGRFNTADSMLQVPVAAKQSMTGVVITGRHVAATEGAKRLDKGFSIFARRKVAALEQ